MLQPFLQNSYCPVTLKRDGAGVVPLSEQQGGTVIDVHWKPHTSVIIAAVGDQQKLGTIQVPGDQTQTNTQANRGTVTWGDAGT